MSSKNRQTVYSTDPKPEPEPAPEKASAPRNPAAPFAVQGNQPVRVHKERQGRGGKTVSVIKGVKSPEAGKKALLKLLKSKLGTGGTLRDDNLEVQGDHREQIVDILNDLGYSAKSAGG